VPQPDKIAKVTWIRLGSVTHSFDQNQRLNTLSFTRGAGQITITAPANANLCPPGHYILYLVDDQGVPSVGHIARITARTVEAEARAAPVRAAVFNAPRPGPVEKDAATIRSAARPAVTVGITPVCIYGLAGCWGGAKGALRRLTGVATVLEEADAFTSTASVFLVDDRLPDLDLWRREFTHLVNASYVLRGVEVTLSGPAEEIGGQLWLRGNQDRPAVRLAPLDANNKLQWDFAIKAPVPLEPEEASAHSRLKRAVGDAALTSVSVTGTLLKDEHGFYLEVRAFAL
jgi:galactose oxidase